MIDQVHLHLFQGLVKALAGLVLGNLPQAALILKDLQLRAHGQFFLGLTWI